MKRVLVTGGAGFVGSHLCKRLLSEGNEVICLDNYFTGNKKNGMWEYFDDKGKLFKIQIYENDLLVKCEGRCPQKKD